MFTTIRILMLSRKLTFDDIAVALKISRNNASDKINGKAKMTVEDIKKIKINFFPDYTLEELSQQED